jgi:hypothetical protein
MYWFLLLTLVALSQEMSVDQWNGNSWVFLDTCSYCTYEGTVNTAISLRVRLDPNYVNFLNIHSTDVWEENIAVYTKLGSPASTTSYDAVYRGPTPVYSDGGPCGVDRYYYIVNQNTLSAADLKFTFSEARCEVDPTGSASSSTSTTGFSTTTTTTTSGTSYVPTTTTSTTSSTSSTTRSSSGSSTSGGNNAPRVAGRYQRSTCDCNGIFCQSAFDVAYTVTQSRDSLTLIPDNTANYATATGTINDAGNVNLVGNGVTCTGSWGSPLISLSCDIQGGAQCSLGFTCLRGDCLERVSSALTLTTNWIMILGLICAVFMILM